MSLWQIIMLGIVQGLTELLPVSSSAHVVVTEKLLGLDPTAPAHTFMLVTLHLGTMMAVLVYFWKRWSARLRSPRALPFLAAVTIATLATGLVGLALRFVFQRIVFPFLSNGGLTEIEQLFGSVPVISGALGAAGVLILVAGGYEHEARRSVLTRPASVLIGVAQGLCLPFRGFSRSGATISSALLAGVDRSLAEDFSFALAILLTPAVMYIELGRYLRATTSDASFGPAAVGMLASFLSGLAALRWLSSWLDRGKWVHFGYYCLFAAGLLATLHMRGVL